MPYFEDIDTFMAASRVFEAAARKPLD
jgi:hypothetical protein